MRYVTSATLALMLAAAGGCSVHDSSHPAQPASAGLSPQAAPDPTHILLDDADIYDVSGSEVVTVIEPPFADDEVVGAWLAVRLAEDLPVEYFEIVANEHFDQWNISVFTVDEDLESAGGANWWMYSGSELFDIVAAQGAEQLSDPLVPDRRPRGQHRWVR